MDTTLLEEKEREQKTFDWVMKCIDSSNNLDHLEACMRLIDFFIEKFGKGELEGQLFLALGFKRNQINYL